MIVSEKKVWLSLGNWFSYFLALYGLFSWFTVMPIVEHRQVIQEACPELPLCSMRRVVRKCYSSAPECHADALP